MDKLTKCYNAVFDEDGNIKVCGREKCSELIMAMQERIKTVDFGNEATGMMNVEGIKYYYDLWNRHNKICLMYK